MHRRKTTYVNNRDIKMKFYDFSGPDIPDDGIADSLQSLIVKFSKPRKAFFYKTYSFFIIPIPD